MIPVKLCLFYLFAGVALGSAISVVLAKNSVRAVLSLVLAFFSTACIWMLLEAEFLAITLVLVYVGAVMVLFLFVVMMLDLEIASFRAGFTRFLPLGVCIAVLVFLALIVAIGPEEYGLSQWRVPEPYPADYSNVKALGELLYTEYLYPLELAGILLLVAIVGAISLTFRGAKQRKTQSIDQQVAVKKADRLTLVQMPAEDKPE